MDFVETGFAHNDAMAVERAGENVQIGFYPQSGAMGQTWVMTPEAAREIGRKLVCEADQIIGRRYIAEAGS